MLDGIERHAGHRFFLPCSGGVASSRSLESAGSRGKMRQSTFAKSTILAAVFSAK
jgi:hypothetical protein